MSKQQNSNDSNQSLIEILGIAGAIIIVFSIWLCYPRFMQSMDTKPEKNPAQIVIPYKPDAMLTSESTSSNSIEEKTKFQSIGDQYGTYGDSYGSLNTLFSGLAFAILIISLFMQRQELQEQRKEIAAQRHEIEKGNEIADKQRKITEQQATLNAQQIHDAKVQNFYNLFFRFLDEKRRKIDDLELTRTSTIRGNYVFNLFIQGVLRRLKASYLTTSLIKEAPDDELELIFNDLVKKGHDITKNHLIESQYFEYICFILRFIEEHKDLGITDTAIKIFISYQSVNEMISIFIVSLENEELKNYIRKYALLGNLNTYEVDVHLLALVDKTIGKKAYTP